MHKFIVAVGLAALCAGCASEGREDIVIIKRHPESGMRMEQVPSAGEMRRVYPAEALRRGVGGRAVIQCVLDGRGVLRNCVVTQETPPGFGFGEAALKVAPKFVILPIDPALSIDGRKIRLPVNFQPG